MPSWGDPVPNQGNASLQHVVSLGQGVRVPVLSLRAQAGALQGGRGQASTASGRRSRAPRARRPCSAPVNTLPEGDGVPVIRAFHHHPRGSARSHREHLPAKRSGLNGEALSRPHDPSPGAADPAAGAPIRGARCSREF